MAVATKQLNRKVKRQPKISVVICPLTELLESAEAQTAQTQEKTFLRSKKST